MADGAELPIRPRGDRPPRSGAAAPAEAVDDHAAEATVLTYIGYSHRKKGDVDIGVGYYRQALAIAPDNLDTREYLGEGYASAGRIEDAKAELATLEKLCGGTSCEQYEDLSNFITTGHE